MQVTRIDAAPSYTLPLHDNIKSLRLQGLEATSASFCAVGLSYYPPGAFAGMSSGPTEKIYVVLEGELVVKLANGERTVLRRFDSCLIEPNESREVTNETSGVATLLVVVPT